MMAPAEIIFRDMPRSEALERRILEKINKLEQLHDHITSCNVIVEETHQHKHRGKLFHIRINLTVPERELVVSHEKHDKQEHEDPYVAVRDAFKAMHRQLTDYSQRLRGSVKAHSRPDTPVVPPPDLVLD